MPDPVKGYSRFVFINSLPRSGSTLLGLLLGHYPQIHFLGEMHRFQPSFAQSGTILDQPCHCGELVYDCEFWNGVAARLDCPAKDLHTHLEPTLSYRWLRNSVLIPGLWGANPGLGRLWPSLRIQLGVASNLIHLAENAAIVACKPVVVANSKRTILARMLAEIDPGRVRIIRLVRDGRGVVNSFRSRAQIPIGSGAAMWARSIAFSRIALKHLPPENFLDVRYEDLAGNRKETLRKILGFVGVDAALPARPTSEVSHHLGGSPRLAGITTLKVALDESWRRQLSSADLAEFELKAGHMNRSLGYRDA